METKKGNSKFFNERPIVLLTADIFISVYQLQREFEMEVMGHFRTNILNYIRENKNRMRLGVLCRP